MRKLLLITGILFLFTCPLLSVAQTVLPTGFSHVLVAPGLTMPTTMEFAPDGRIFVAEQNGALRIVKNGSLLTRPFLTLAVNTNGERGLLGIALDPSFQSNHYIYLCYTVPSGTFNRVSRFTASGDTVVPGSEQIVMNLDTLIANYHTGGHLSFGPDGKLYIATGENGRSVQSQNLDSYLGKILRINSDGSVPAGNPFPGPAKRQKVWVYGLRNPFTFTFQPGTGRMFVDDVGEVTYEEINDITTGGGNYGWPQAEGHSNDTNFVNPFYFYVHGTGVNLGCAITGGTFFSPDTTNYPAQYRDKYYFIDYCGNWINSVTLTDTPAWSNFATSIANYPVGITTGPDGNLYYLSRNNEAMYKIVYTADSVPLVVNQPQSQIISVTHPVTFSVTASGRPPLNYQWRKGTTNIPGANSDSYTIPNTAYSDSGNYNVIVSNSFGADTSANAHLTITGNQPPTAVIDTPLVNTLYSAGDLIPFHGSASDPEDGVLPDSAFDWLVEFHHFTHVHPGPNSGSGISSGSFTIPVTGEVSANVFYRLILIVHDSAGLTDSAFVDIYPRTSSLTINTQPQGLTITLDGQPFTTPHTVLGVEGMMRTISAPYTQPLGQTPMYFTSWSHGGPLTQTFATPVNDSAWTANFDSLQLSYNIGADTIICTIDSLVIDAGSQYSTYAWTDGSVDEFFTLKSSVPDTLAIGVTVTDSNGLAGYDSRIVIFETCNSVSETGRLQLRIYPVPSTGEINIIGLKQKSHLKIVDMTGRTVMEKNITDRDNQSVLLNEGIYCILITDDSNRSYIGKVVISK